MAGRKRRIFGLFKPRPKPYETSTQRFSYAGYAISRSRIVRNDRMTWAWTVRKNGRVVFQSSNLTGAKDWIKANRPHDLKRSEKRKRTVGKTVVGLGKKVLPILLFKK